jgi:hypothetical protein
MPLGQLRYPRIMRFAPEIADEQTLAVGLRWESIAEEQVVEIIDLGYSTI